MSENQYLLANMTTIGFTDEFGVEHSVLATLKSLDTTEGRETIDIPVVFGDEKKSVLGAYSWSFSSELFQLVNDDTKTYKMFKDAIHQKKPVIVTVTSAGVVEEGQAIITELKRQGWEQDGTISFSVSATGLGKLDVVGKPNPPIEENPDDGGDEEPSGDPNIEQILVEAYNYGHNDGYMDASNFYGYQASAFPYNYMPVLNETESVQYHDEYMRGYDDGFNSYEEYIPPVEETTDYDLGLEAGKQDNIDGLPHGTSNVSEAMNPDFHNGYFDGWNYQTAYKKGVEDATLGYPKEPDINYQEISIQGYNAGYDSVTQ